MRRCVAVMALALCGCGGADRGPSGEDRNAAPAGDSLGAPIRAVAPVLTDSGLGPVHIGMSVEEARSALGGDLKLDDPIGTEEGPDGCRFGTSSVLPPGTSIMFEGQHAVRVDVDTAVATSSGLRIGQNEARVRAAHPALREEPHHYVTGKYLVVIPGAPSDTMRRIVFETDSAGTVTALRAGVYPQVQYVEGCA
jgi:hypothetical protein